MVANASDSNHAANHGKPGLVSIVVPAYNAARTIGEMIASVLAQTCPDFELVVCNDASTDATAAVVRGFADPRIRLLENDTNLGEGASRDRAIAAARGQWIAMLDADDAWQPQRLERLLAVAGDAGNCMVFDDLLRCHDTPAGLVAWRRLRGPSAFGSRGIKPRDVPVERFIQSDRLLIKPLVPASCIRAGDIRHGLSRFGADTEFFLRLLATGVRLRYVPEAMYLYRITPGSATANPARHRLMRECVEAAMALPGFAPSAREALRGKVEALRRKETYASFVGAVRGADWRASWRILVRNPWLPGRMLRRVLQATVYNLHRRRHSGSGRVAS